MFFRWGQVWCGSFWRSTCAGRGGLSAMVHHWSRFWYQPDRLYDILIYLVLLILSYIISHYMLFFFFYIISFHIILYFILYYCFFFIDHVWYIFAYMLPHVAYHPAMSPHLSPQVTSDVFHTDDKYWGTGVSVRRFGQQIFWVAPRCAKTIL